ncbi:MAG: hypothetical protein ACRESO_04950, partial [Gammaproteobacteria bacterium]
MKTLWVTAVMCSGLLAGCGTTSVAQATVQATHRDAGDTNGVAASTGRQMYIVQLQDAPLTTYAGSVRGLAPTAPQVTGARTLDLDSPASRAYLDYLKAQQSHFIDSMNNALGRTVMPAFIYFYALNGMAVSLSPAEA